MNILAFDTCFDACSVCVAQARAERAVEFSGALERFETGHAERLIPMVEEVMSRAGLTFSDIDRLAVRYTGEPFRTRHRRRFSARIEIAAWHGWVGTEPWPIDS